MAAAGTAVRQPAPPRPAEDKSPPAKSGATVSVACKIPIGLRLQVTKPQAMKISLGGGMFRDEDIQRPFGEPYMLHGWRTPPGETPKVPVVAGYAINHGVPKDLWDAWLKQNDTMEIVINRLVFAMPTPDAARGEAREHKNVLSGLEPLNMGRKMQTVRGKERSVPVDPRLVSLAKIRPDGEKADDPDDE